ncbi:DUF1911 domain-containing protein [Oceanimonas sp. CHS3-5]|uniref:DUF6630 family protein n=1 Tax=Oceanimonas sp. CHS3-5 TaxID=3068186 RepID=UPI00273DABF4|nr:PoNe immunity protein domain-containing protein [Oceanimonas sp. CHS3-5]MDP5291293.1 DUF1911 domain-containing protein [Oceanimonas sp. CHS3-5]
MRNNKFFQDIDLDEAIDNGLKRAEEYCTETYITNRISQCNGDQKQRVLCYRMAYSRLMNMLQKQYVRGDSLDSIQPYYLQTRECLRLLEEAIHVCGMENAKMDIINPINVGFLLALGHALGESRNEIGRNTRAMSAGYDLFIDRLLSVYEPERPLADGLSHKAVYKNLYAVFDAPAEERPGMIARYLDEWEKLLLKNKLPGHLYPVPERLQKEWEGFWCYPAAAVVAALNIDDSTFIDHEFYPTDLMRACAQYRGEPVILPPLPEPELPEPPKRSPRRKPAPERLASFQPMFDSLVTALPKSLQACLWNALVDWLNEEGEEACLEAVDLPGIVVEAQWDMELRENYRRLALLQVDWKDDESALSFCADLARTLGIKEAFEPDPLSLTRPERVWEVLNTFHQWLAPHDYCLISPFTGEDAYYALPLKTRTAKKHIAVLEQAGLKVNTFAGGHAVQPG